MPITGTAREVNKDNQLFIAICKWSFHAFLVVGVHDNVTNENYVLFTIGQKLNYRDGWWSNICNFLFSPADSALYEEHFPYDEKHAITYKSFELTTSQYGQLIDNVLPNLFLGRIDPRVAHGYLPQETSGNDGSCSTFKYSPISTQTHEQIKANLNMQSEYRKLSTGNNCHHAGIRLFKQLLGDKVAIENQVSSSFMRQLPFSTIIDHGQFSNNLFIFPLPPNKSELSDAQYKLLSCLYRRLEDISKTYTKHHKTLEKFNAVKALYHQLNPSHKAVDIHSLFMQIYADWERQNKSVIDSKRGFSIFTNTETRNTLITLCDIANHHKSSATPVGN